MKNHRAKQRIRLLLHWLLIVSLIAGLWSPGLWQTGQAEAAAVNGTASAASDINGHWAEPQLSDWIGGGYIKGFQDGSFRPDQTISRIEFVALVNRLFAYQGTGKISFKDVPSAAWFVSQVQAAVQAGYVKGFPDGTFQPDKPLSRVEAAVMLAKLTPVLMKDGEDPLKVFKDAGSIPGYGRDALGAVLSAGYMKGFPDGTIAASRQLTRAEAVVLLDRLKQQSGSHAEGGIIPPAKTLETGGTYGPVTGSFTVAGDLTLNAPGITLRNVQVQGNLLIGSKVGDGEIYLEQVTVQGSTDIQGGGAHSVHINHSQLGVVTVDRADGLVRVVVGGTSIIRQLNVQSDAKLESEQSGTASGGIEGVVISGSGEVTLSGEFSSVEIKSNVKVVVTSGTIGRLSVAGGVSASSITLNEGVKVSDLELHGTASVSGAGEIVKALVDAPKVVFERSPGSVETTTRGEYTVTAPAASTAPAGAGGAGGTGGGSGGGGGGGGGSNPTTPPSPTSTPSPTPQPTLPPAEQPLEVAVTAALGTLSGFMLSFSKPVANLTAAELSLKDTAGQAVGISFIGSLNGGSSYRVAAALKDGETYTVTLSKAGYAFGAPVTLVIPVTTPEDIRVATAVQNISVAGLEVQFDQPVADLPLSGFTLKRSGTGEAVAIQEAAAHNGGSSYQLTAALQEGATYLLSVTKAGYHFGGVVSVFVPVTDPVVIPVSAEVYGITETGFQVSLNPPVAGLTPAHFALTAGDGSSIQVDGAASAEDGGVYTITAGLVPGSTYTLSMERSGYSFGTALEVTVPAVGKVKVEPSIGTVRTYGFILSMDKTVPEIDSLSLVLENAAGGQVSIDMLSTVVPGRQYEVWASLAPKDWYTLSLDMDGYEFTEPAALAVRAEEVPSSAGWVTHSGFELQFAQGTPDFSAGDMTLQAPGGGAVAVDEVQLGLDRKSAVIAADLPAAGSYAYHVNLYDGRFIQGTVVVPETVEISKYTTFDGYPGAYSGLTVHFGRAVPGLTVSAFELKNSNGGAVVLDSAGSSDGGRTYKLLTTQINAGGPFVLGITAPGYSFGKPALLVNATLNVWGAGRKPTQFMAGLNPRVPDLTAEHFRATDLAGHEVAITGVTWDNQQRIYVVAFDGEGGQSYYVSVQADGYDFGAPKKIYVYAQNTVVDPTYSGFTLVMSPAMKINTQYGFKLTKAFGGPEVPIKKVVMNDPEGGSYQFSAALTPGYYSLALDADVDPNVVSFAVPLIATVSVDEIENSGLLAKLDYAVDGLGAGNFVLLNNDTGDPVVISSATTADQGASYRLSAHLAGGSYTLKLTGHLPEAGVKFKVAATTDAGTTSVSKITSAGFELSFANPVPGLLPDDLTITDAQNNKLNGVTLTTSDNGGTYQVRVTLAENADYTIVLKKGYILFGSPVTFHVNKWIAASIADVTKDGQFTLKFAPEFPEIENYLGLSLTDEAGTLYYPNLFESADGGASYQLRVPGNQLKPGMAYMVKLDKDEFSMNPVSFRLPPTLTVMEATTASVKVQLDAPVPGLAQRHFVIRNAAGDSIALTSAATADAGAHYTLAGTFAGGQTYTVQYKPDVTYQVNEPVAFPISKIITAALSNITVLGFKLQFSSKVAGLTPQQVILRDPSGNPIPVNEYSLKTTDQGLSYQVTLNAVAAGKGYTLDLAREDFRLASPVSFDISASAALRLVGTVLNKIVVSVSPNLPDMTEEHFALYDSKGRKIAITVTSQGPASAMYNIEGKFDAFETYTLQAKYPGYLFGAPLTVGFQVGVYAIIHGQSRSGFKLVLSSEVPGLSAADITVTDKEGNIAAVQSLQASTAPGSYNVLVPLAGGKTYTVKIAAKAPYVFDSIDPFTLNAASATVDQLSVTGFKLSLSSPLSLDPGNVSLTDDQGQTVNLRSVITRDAGRSYEISVYLKAGVQYKLGLHVAGYDLGTELPLSIQAVAAAFEGMETGNNQAFTVRFDQAMPSLLPGDFNIKQGDNATVYHPMKISTADGGFTYKVEASFWGTERYSLRIVKHGYDFGTPIFIDVPAGISAAVLRIGADYVEIGLNPGVFGMSAADFTVKDSTGQVLPVSSAVTDDHGLTYRLKAAFAGGQTYTIALQQTGHDFGEVLPATLPSVIASEVGPVNGQGVSVLLNPAVGGLKAGSFKLVNAAGQSTPVTVVKELNGGAGYVLSANLADGAVYTLAVAGTGYDFGAALAVKVPVQVALSYDKIQNDGLTVKLDPAIPGLSAASFILKDAEGNQSVVSAATTLDGGATYAMRAALQYGATYSLNIAAAGYDFGTVLPFTVLQPVAKSIEALSKNGFTLRLQAAVPDLKVSHILLKDSSGEAVALDSLVTADGGLTYQAAAKLTEGAAYRLALTAQGYDFGPSVHLDVLPMLQLTASSINTSGFSLHLSKAVPDLNLSSVHLSGPGGQSVTLTASSFYDANPGTADAGKIYLVRVPIAAGQTYTLMVQDPSHPVEGPLEVVLPVEVTSQVTRADAGGISVLLGRKGIDVQPEDVELLTAAGDRIKVTGIAAGTDAGTYIIQTQLAEGSTYSLTLKKAGYDFGAAVKVYVAYRVTSSITGVNENGFTVSFSTPVQGVQFSLQDAGNNPVTLGPVSTADFGQTYKVAANLAYNKEFKLRLDAAGYDLGAELTVNNVSTPPLLMDATSSENGTQVILTFDKPLASVIASGSFSVKIDGQWQSSVTAVLGADPAQILLSWNSSGRVIGSASTVSVAYTGVNRVKAVNQTFLAVFDELPVANVATLLGFVTSYAYKNDAAYPAQILHKQYGKTALETAELLRDGGFKAANLYRAVLIEYGMIRSELTPILYAMNADASALYDAYNSLKPATAAYDGLIVPEFLSAGYSISEIAPVLQRFGLLSKGILGYLKRYNVSVTEAAKVLKGNWNETSGNTVQLLRLTGYDSLGIAGAVQSAYGLSHAQAVSAMAEGKQPATESAAVIKELYSGDAVTSANWLSQAGYSAADVSKAIAEQYSFAGAAEMLRAFMGAGFPAAYTYSLLRREYSQQDAATELLNAKVSAREVAEAVKSAGDGASVIISALMAKHYEVQEIAIIVNDLWVSAGVTLSEVLAQFAASGYQASAQAALLREQFGAELPAAIAALSPGLTQSQREHILKYLLDGGYDPVQLADYYLKQGSNTYELFRQFRLAGKTPVQSLQTMYDAYRQAGTALTLSGAMDLFYHDYNNRYEAADVLTALRAVFVQDRDGQADATAIAAAMSNSRLWDKVEIAGPLIRQMGLTMQDWVELERTEAFSRFGCACDVRTVVKDTQYLFAGATLPDITVAMSLSSRYTLNMIVEGTINLYPTGGVRAKGMPYLISALKNAGYSFEEVAAEFDSQGWSEWVAAFSTYGIAANDVTAYLVTKGLTMSQVIDRLAPYPLKDRALVLREAYGLDSAAAMALLIQQTNEDQEDIGRAAAWAYGSDPISLWIQTLRAQGATAASVINTLAARYPAYWQSDKVGPALIQGGFSQDEVMRGLLIHAGVRGNLQATLGLLQSLYSQQQFTIAQLLSAAKLVSPEDGLEFLQKGGYKLPDMARALKDYYGLTAGEAAKLLTAAYPNDQSLILSGLASVYGQTLGSTIAEALQEQGITEVSAAVEYLWNAGFAPRDIASSAKDAFHQDAGQTALLFVQKNILADRNVLVTTLAAVYGQSVEQVIHALLVRQGSPSFEEAISFVFQARFSLANSIRLAKTEYGLSAGTALQLLTDSRLYRQEDILAGVTDIYRTSQRESIVDSLAASGLVTLESAVSFLRNMKFDLNGIVRVGKEHYRLTAGETAAALTVEGSYGDEDIQNSVSYVYGQNLTQTRLDTLNALGITVFADAVPELRSAGFALADLVLAGKTHYKLSAGETTYSLLQSGGYPVADILAAVAEYYGKPVNDSVEELLNRSGIASIQDAAPYLRSLGYTLQDVIEVSKSYYGNSLQATRDALLSLQLEDASIIEWTVRQVYGTAVEEGNTAATPQSILQEAGITGEQAAIAYLWTAGYPLQDIVKMLKEYNGQSAAAAAALLIADGSFSASAVLSSISAIYGTTYDAATMEFFRAQGIFTDAPQAAQVLSTSGYRMAYIAELLKKSYGKTEAEAKEILNGLGIYTADAVQKTVAEVYFAVGTSSGTLQQLLDLYGITGAEAAVSLLYKQGTAIQDILQYLKDAYNLGADEATALLAVHVKGPELGLAVTTVYYSSTNIGYLAKLIPATSMGSPGTVASYMKAKFRDTDIVLALKVIFNLDALGVQDAISTTIMSAERVRAAVTEVFGADPLYAYLKRMKDRGANANDVAAELYLRGLLELAPSSYLVDTLRSLGYDNTSILKMRYNYFNEARQNAGTEEEQGTQLVQLGVNTPAAIVQYLRKWNLLPYKVIKIVKAGLPNAPIAEIALAMREYGYTGTAIMGGLDAVGEGGDAIAAILKKLGLSVPQALVFLRDWPVDEQLQWLIRNDYTPSEYIAYRNVQTDNTIAVLRQQLGLSAIDVAKLLNKYKGSMSHYSLAKALYDGGFTQVSEVAGALISINYQPVWLLGLLVGIGGWTMDDIAQGMLDSGLISLVDLGTAIQMATGGVLKETYRILKKVSTAKQREFYDSLDSLERKLLDNNEIAMIVVVSAMRNGRISISDATNQLKVTEGIEPEDALKVLIVSGANVLDSAGAVWDVYRDYIGAKIVLKMFEKAAGQYISDFKNYYKLVMTLSKIIYKLSK
ncbi:S-layer homology domain-containing protein [Paenibacillus sp. FSL R7-0210]|uniref:S-layer homology domain-containing protein n=1 Tax=Paenibacillus sp. FSL R7-0210 TaxID=2921676 RepID=UPI0030FBF565